MSDTIEWKPEWKHLAQARDDVEELYRFRDHFFEEHELEEANKKNVYVQEKLATLQKEMEGTKAECESENRAVYIYLQGRALNVTPDYDVTCEQLLSRAIKLNPRLSAAWNELGECYWKKGDVNSAMDCFNGALKHKKNKLSLRNLSMVLRQQRTKSQEELISNVEEGLKKAKEALELDFSDGLSWTILGNAYLQAYFHLSQDPKTLQLCMHAYGQAEKDVVAKSSPDLHYNKGVVWRYTEDYEKSLSSFQKAKNLDPAWSDPSDKVFQVFNYLTKVQDLIQYKGRLKAKRLQQMLKKLSEKDLGPYGPKQNNQDNKNSPMKQVPIGELYEGANKTIIVGKVVCTVPSEDNVPFSFCIVDKEETCVCVNLYNLAAGKGVIIGDSVAIPEPFLRTVKIKYKDKDFSFPLIRTDNPTALIVNGRALGMDNVATARAATFKKQE